MPRASFVSLQLARFDAIRAPGPVTAADRPGLLFCAVAADVRAAGSEPASLHAFSFALLGLHADAASAHALVEDGPATAPWMAEASEAWRGVLQPYRHKGEANYLDRAQPGPLFDALAPPAAADAPFVVITSSGWNTGDGLDMNRVREFSAGVMAVRVSMTGIAGLHSQQSFFFARGLELDPMTVSFWRDDASVRAFAYAPGSHRHQMDRARDHADRTSFTRCHVRHHEGTWYGGDPVAFAGHR